MKKLNSRYVLVALVFLIACTREVDESVSLSIDTSKISGGNQKVNQGPNSQSTVPSGYYPVHVIANLHYDGRTEVAEWDCRIEPISNCVVPSSINFNNKKFPNGGGRVAQVLLVYENDQDQMIFYYSHALNITFGGGSVNIVLNTWVNNGASPGTGNIAGRYYDMATNSGPTGKLIGSYSPPRPPGYTDAQIPDMKLFKSFMFNGYFQVFFLKGATKFSWTLINPEGQIIKPIFTQKSLDDFASSLATTKRGIHVVRPDFYNVYPVSGSLSSYAKVAEDTVLGFFKSSAAPGSIEYYTDTELSAGGFVFKSVTNGAPGIDASPELISNSYMQLVSGNLVDPVDSSGQWVNPTNPASIMCSGVACTAANWDAYRLKVSVTTSDSNRVRVVGGNTTDQSACSTALSVPNTFVTDHCFKAVLGNEAKGGVTPFRGPFSLHVIPPDFNTFISYLPSTTNPTTHTEFKWAYLPNMTSLIDGTEVFLIPKTEIEDLNEQEGLDCPYLAGSPNAISLGSVVGLSAINQKLEVANTVLNATSNSEILLCPYKDVSSQRVYLPFGIATQGYQVNLPPINVSVSAISSTIAQGTCTPVTVTLSRATVGATTVTVTTNNPSISSSNTCGGTGDATTSVVLSFPSGTSTKTFYIDGEAATSAIATFTVSGVDVYNPTAIPNQSFSITASPTLSVTGLTGAISETVCHPFTLGRNNTSGTITVTLPFNTSNIKYLFYTDPACTALNAGTTVNMTAGQSSISLYLKSIVASDQINEVLTFTAAGFGSASGTITINDTAAVIFVTSATFPAGTTGVTWGDPLCASAATAAGLPTGVYKAALSSSAETAVTRIGNLVSTKPFVNTKGQAVAPTISGTGGLFSLENLENPIYTELADVASDPVANDGYVWTGSDATGTLGGHHCSNWTSASGSWQALNGPPTTGSTSVVDSSRFNRGGTTVPCNSFGRLYCVGN